MKILFSLKPNKNSWYVSCIPTYIYENISLNSYNEKCFRQTFFDKIKARILYSITTSRKSCRLCDNVENITQPYRPQMAHVHCMLDTKGYKHTHTHTHVV